MEHLANKLALHFVTSFLQIKAHTEGGAGPLTQPVDINIPGIIRHRLVYKIFFLEIVYRSIFFQIAERSDRDGHESLALLSRL